MKKLKRSLCLILVIIYSISAFACSPNSNVLEETTNTVETNEKATIKLAGLSGPTSMGLSKLLIDNKNGNAENNYDFTLVGSADQITPLLIKGDLDMAAVPANLASILYNKTNGKIQVLAINTLGVIYIVERKDNVNSISDLKGKKLYISGKGQTPEFLTRYLLKSNAIDPDTDVEIEFKTEHQEIVSVLKEDEDAIAVLPQPFITIAQSQIPDLKIAIDTTEEYNKINNNMLITGVMVANKNFVDNNKETVNKFLKEYENSINFVNNNVEEASKYIGELNIFKEEVAKKALPKCNIYFEKGEKLKQDLSAYLDVLYQEESASIGGAMPQDNFYYIG